MENLVYYPEDIETKILINKVNRINKLKPTTGKFWCNGCDGYLVGESEKCPYCGTRNIKNRHVRLKKE